MHASQLETVTPCTKDWSSMEGDERRRFCDQCSKHVHDLSEHTEEEALEIVQQPEVCAQFRVDPQSGSVLFRKKAARIGRAALITATLLGASSPAFASGATAESPGIWSRLASWLNGPAATEETKLATIPEAETHTTDTSSTDHSKDEMPPMPGGIRFHPVPQAPAVPTAPPKGGVR